MGVFASFARFLCIALSIATVSSVDQGTVSSIDQGQTINSQLSLLKKELHNVGILLQSKTNVKQHDELLSRVVRAQTEIDQLNASVGKVVDSLENAVNETVRQKLQLDRVESIAGDLKTTLDRFRSQLTACLSQQLQLSAMVTTHERRLNTLSGGVSSALEKKVKAAEGTLKKHDDILTATALHNFQIAQDQLKLDKEVKNLSSRISKQNQDLENNFRLTMLKVSELERKQASSSPSCSCNSSVSGIRADVTSLMSNQQSLVQQARANSRSILTLGTQLNSVKGSNMFNYKIQHFTWTTFTNQNNGEIKAFPFAKTSRSTGLRLTFHGNLLVNPRDGRFCCSRWYFTINGKTCSSPSSVENIIGKSGNSVGYMLPATVSGICYGTADGAFSGNLKLGLSVGQCMHPRGNVPTCQAITGTDVFTPMNVVIEEL